ncbi:MULTISPECIES: MerR family transcriptional regulator [unclassified Rhizobium]|nr:MULTISPECIES: MerR family transcriptional regulator [unclassified Rhizobium]
MTSRKIHLTAAQCAKRVGLTVRALRLYEQTGLIHPRRTDANWRLYGAREIARLNEILTLKRLGLSLQHIARLLAGQATDLDRMLHMQNVALRERLARTQHSLAIVDALRAKTAAGVSISVEGLLQLAKDTMMTDTSLDDVAGRRYDQARPRKEKKIEPAFYADYEGYASPSLKSSPRWFHFPPFVSASDTDGRIVLESQTHRRRKTRVVFIDGDPIGSASSQDGVETVGSVAIPDVSDTYAKKNDGRRGNGEWQFVLQREFLIGDWIGRLQYTGGRFMFEKRQLE